jgi:hypothetical protein
MRMYGQEQGPNVDRPERPVLAANPPLGKPVTGARRLTPPAPPPPSGGTDPCVVAARCTNHPRCRHYGLCRIADAVAEVIAEMGERG